eukprot:3166007-Heterocapsa_arctica.AAC.1
MIWIKCSGSSAGADRLNPHRVACRGAGSFLGKVNKTCEGHPKAACLKEDIQTIYVIDGGACSEA